MAICTLKAHVARAMDFYNHDDIYFAIGKSSNWSSSDLTDFDSSRDYNVNPPEPKNTDDMKEVIGYKKAEYKSFVVQDDINGTLDYRNTKWRVVNKEDAATAGARWVYVSTELLYEELPTELPYRCIGVYTGLTLADGVSSSKFNLLPSEVKDAGLLQVIDYRKPIYRNTDVKEKIKLILEF